MEINMDPAQLAELKNAAEEGFARAQFNLALCYHHGGGVEKDFDEALKWYTKSADQGNINACYTLGCLYYEGTEVTQDWSKAAEYFKITAQKGHTTARHYYTAC